MAKDNKKRSKLNDKIRVLLVAVPLFFYLIAGLIWIDGGFQGTFMQKLFPALLFGAIYAVFTMYTIDNISLTDVNRSRNLLVGQSITFVSATVLCLLGFVKVLAIILIIWAFALMFFVFFKRLCGF